MEHTAQTVQMGAQIELAVEGINHLGQGVGRYNGLTIFIPGGLPGDRVQVLIDKTHTRYAVGRLIRILAPSPDRIVPACPLAQRCGGCSLQSLAYPAQLRLKGRLILDALSRIAHLAGTEKLLRPIIGMDDPWHYRTKVQFPVAGSSTEPQIGFYAAMSHDVVDGESCPIQPALCDHIRAVVRHHMIEYKIEPYHEARHEGLLRHLVIRIGANTGEVMVILVINGETLAGQQKLFAALQEEITAVNSTFGESQKSYQLTSFYLNSNKEKTNLVQSTNLRLLAGKPWIEEEILGLRYRISPLSFFQVNPVQTAHLFRTVLEFAKPEAHETIADLYCGTGSITLQLARKASCVIGIESNESAIEDARANAERNGIHNVEFHVDTAEHLLPELIDQGLVVDCVVLDPPRKGCDPNLIDTLIRCKPERIVYVSCNPATLARDIALLSPAGYKVDAVQPVDMFPWTMHVEMVVLMSRVETGKA